MSRRVVCKIGQEREGSLRTVSWLYDVKMRPHMYILYLLASPTLSYHCMHALRDDFILMDDDDGVRVNYTHGMMMKDSLCDA
jgi:hypothetical protein